MKTHQSYRCLSYKNSVIIFLFLGVANLIRAQDVSLMVISNISGAPGEMKMSEVKSVFKCEKQRWKDNSKVSLYLMKTTTLTGKITGSKIFDKSGQGVLSFYLGLQFAGKIDPPTFCNSAEELESKIADNPGSIGITDKMPANSNIKVILVDGKKTF
jgi:hypothetical protein